MSARLAAGLILCAALSGCGGSIPTVGGTERAQAADLMNYFGRAAQIGPQQQKQELVGAQQDCVQPARSLACLRLGGLYAQPAPVLRNDARALELLRWQTGASAPTGEGARALADLAALLLVQVEERQRLVRSEEKKQEALRSTNETLRERVRAIGALERANIEREDRVRSDQLRRE